MSLFLLTQTTVTHSYLKNLKQKNSKYPLTPLQKTTSIYNPSITNKELVRSKIAEPVIFLLPITCPVTCAKDLTELIKNSP